MQMNSCAELNWTILRLQSNHNHVECECCFRVPLLSHPRVTTDEIVSNIECVHCVVKVGSRWWVRKLRAVLWYWYVCELKFWVNEMTSAVHNCILFNQKKKNLLYYVFSSNIIIVTCKLNYGRVLVHVPELKWFHASQADSTHAHKL